MASLWRTASSGAYAARSGWQRKGGRAVPAHIRRVIGLRPFLGETAGDSNNGDDDEGDDPGQHDRTAPI